MDVSERRRLLRDALLLFVIYVILAQAITFMTSFGNFDAAAFWPAAGVTVVFLSIHARRAWPVLMLTILLAEFTVDMYNDLPAGVAIGWGVANAIEPAVSVYLLRRLGLASLDLRRKEHFTRFFVVAVVVGPLLASLVASSVTALLDFGPLWPTVPRWWIGDAVGVLVVAPAILHWRERRFGSFLRDPAVLVLGAAVAVAFALPHSDPWTHTLPFLVVPLTVLVVLRNGSAGACCGVLLVAVLTQGMTAAGYGPFAGEQGSYGGLIVAQGFLMMLAFSAHSVATLTSDLVSKKALEESERRYRIVSEVTSDLAFGASFDGQSFSLDWATDGFERVVGIPFEELQGPDEWLKMIDPRDLDVVTSAIAESLEKRRAQLVIRFNHPSGETRWLDCRMKWADGDTIYGSIRDVTQERTMGERLAQAGKMESIGRLAGGVAHDFNNLLMIIAASASLVRDSVEDPEVLGDIDHIIQATKRGSSLTNQMLMFARRDSYTSNVVDVVALMEEWVPFVRRAVGERIVIDSVLPNEQLWVDIDADKLSMSILNLVANSRDAMPDGGGLTISCRRADLEGDRAVAIEVTDEGTGMSEQVRAVALEPFFSTKDLASGTGLGLAIVYGTVAEAGGVVDIASIPGEGTVVTMYLPLTDAPESVQEDELMSADGPSKKRILLVDDEPSLREALARRLMKAGHQVWVAASGDEGLSLALSHPFDLVLTDVVMPGMSGRVMVDSIYELVGRMPIVFMSGYTADHLGELKDHERFISKPFDLPQLNTVVQELLDDEDFQATRRTDA